MNKTPSSYVTLSVFLSLMTIITLIGWYCQNNLLLNSDVSWFMHAAERLLSGGTYANDYFEVNPPMIIYLSIPPVLISKLFGIPAYTAARFFVFALGIFSLVLCKTILDRSISETNQSYRSLYLLALAAIYFIMPISDFGQREHLLVIFTMPYFLLVASRIETYQPVSKRLAIMIGLMAGIGFAIKPYFYAPFLLVEFYYFKKNRIGARFMRTETTAIFSILAVYAVAILLFHRDYLTDILPFITQYYYQSYSSPFGLLLFNHNTYYVVLALLVALICAKSSDQQALLKTLMLATLGFFIAYLMQRTQWFYHVYPMLALSTLLIGLSLAELIARSHDFDVFINLSLISGIVQTYMFYNFTYLPQIATFQIAAYFSIFIVIFSYMFYVASRNESLIKMLGFLTLLFYVGFIFYENVSMSSWEHWIFSLSTIMLFLLFALFIPAPNAQVKFQFLFYSVVAALFLAYPFYQVSYIYNGNTSYKNLYQNLLSDLNKYPHQSVAFISDSSEFAFPAIDYTHHTFASRFGALGGLPQLRYDDDDKAYQLAYLQNKFKMDFIVSAIVTDMERYRPEMVLVDRREADKTRKLGYYGNNQTNYLKLFSINSRFAEVWKNYHYVATIDGQPLYRFEIYTR